MLTFDEIVNGSFLIIFFKLSALGKAVVVALTNVALLDTVAQNGSYIFIDFPLVFFLRSIRRKK